MHVDNNRLLKAYVSQLETRLDFLETQFSQLNLLLEQVGFEGGLGTLIEAINEMDRDE